MITRVGNNHHNSGGASEVNASAYRLRYHNLVNRIMDQRHQERRERQRLASLSVADKARDAAVGSLRRAPLILAKRFSVKSPQP